VVSSTPKEVHVHVRDDGDGIAADALPRVFDLFMQGNVSIDRAQGGLGIGLSLVRGLVELHGGTIEAKSDGPGTGSEFIVSLPLTDIVPGAERTEPPPGRRDGPQRILIVDDNVDAATALAATLRDRHTVALAHSGPVGIETARSFQPQVALIDLGMPGMNGFEVAERLRAAHPGLLLVAVSGYSGEESRRRARDAQFDEFVVKPFPPEVVEALLSRRAR
jgi:CheY-like chemotaxis protein